MSVRGLDVHRAIARTALFLAMRPRGATMAAILARPLLGTAMLLILTRVSLRALLVGLTLRALLVGLTLLALPLVLLGAVLARSAASTTPSAASPSGIFAGGTVRSTIHIVVTLLLCVTWTF